MSIAGTRPCRPAGLPPARHRYSADLSQPTISARQSRPIITARHGPSGSCRRRCRRSSRGCRGTTGQGPAGSSPCRSAARGRYGCAGTTRPLRLRVGQKPHQKAADRLSRPMLGRRPPGMLRPRSRPTTSRMVIVSPAQRGNGPRRPGSPPRADGQAPRRGHPPCPGQVDDAGIGALEQVGEDGVRGVELRRQARPDDDERVDGYEVEARLLRLDEGPGGALGLGLEK